MVAERKVLDAYVLLSKIDKTNQILGDIAGKLPGGAILN
jgi:hypothetical protein